MMKKCVLAMSVAVALAGCNSSSSDSKPSSFTITAIDGYLANAQVWVDLDDDLTNGCEHDTNLVTDEKGQASLPSQYKDLTVCIKAIEGETVDSNRGVVQHSFDLANSGAGSEVNPMTNVVKKLRKENAELTQTEAEERVVESITKSGLDVTSSLVFGDYIAANTEQAEALNLIGEVLVDYSEQPVETKLLLVEAMAEETQKIIENENESLDDFSPIIDIPSNGGSVEVTPNRRPSVTGELDSQSIEIGDAIEQQDVSELFNDPDPEDVLTFSMQALGGVIVDGIHLDAETGLLTGQPTVAGEFEFHIFATDQHGARSYPLTFNLDVATENLPPVVDDNIAASIQVEMNSWSLVEGEAITHTLSFDGLFTYENNDVLSYEAETTLSVNGNGFDVAVHQAEVTFSGMLPRSAAAGEETLTISANDGVNTEWVSAEFDFPIIEEAPLPPGGDHPLEDKAWFFNEKEMTGMLVDSDLDHDILRVWCESVKFSGGKVYMSEASTDNFTQCDQPTIEVPDSSYTINGNTLEWTITFTEDGVSETETLTLDIQHDADPISNGAKVVLASIQGTNHYQRVTWFTNQADAEARINLASDAPEEDNDYKMYLPGEQEFKYELGVIGLSLGLPVAGDQGKYDANLTFDVPGMDMTCSGLREFYRSFVLTGVDVYGNPFESWSGGSYDGFECYTNEENGVEYAAVDFDIYQELAVGNVYSVIGQAKYTEGQYIEEVRANITWNGEK